MSSEAPLPIAEKIQREVVETEERVKDLVGREVKSVTVDQEANLVIHLQGGVELFFPAKEQPEDAGELERLRQETKERYNILVHKKVAFVEVRDKSDVVVRFEDGTTMFFTL